MTTDSNHDLAEVPPAPIGDLDIDRLLGDRHAPASDKDLGDGIATIH